MKDKEMKDGNYQNYLRTTHWKNKRKEVIKAKGSVCSICFSDNNIQIHHSKYTKGCKKKSVLFHESNKILYPLCARCHGKWHKYFGHNIQLNKFKIKRANLLYINGISIDDSIRFCFSGSLAKIILESYVNQKEMQPLSNKKMLKRPIISPNTKRELTTLKKARG